jgi:hypothetical protein
VRRDWQRDQHFAVQRRTDGLGERVDWPAEQLANAAARAQLAARHCANVHRPADATQHAATLRQSSHLTGTLPTEVVRLTVALHAQLAWLWLSLADLPALDSLRPTLSNVHSRYRVSRAAELLRRALPRLRVSASTPWCPSAFRRRQQPRQPRFNNDDYNNDNDNKILM